MANDNTRSGNEELPHANPSRPSAQQDNIHLARRRFLQSAGALATTPLMPSPATAAASASSGDVSADDTGPVRMTLHVNGVPRELRIDPRVTLLDALREHLGLTGTKKGCDRGQCGACTVLVNDRRIDACLSLAVMHDGDRITTIEGIGQPDRLHPMQAAFIAYDAFQCGFCTPGQICSAIAMLNEARLGDPSAATADVRVKHVTLTADEIRERMSGNLCRCGAYPHIVTAIAAVAHPDKGES